MLRLGVVHGNNGILQRAVFRHGAQANHARGGLFGSPNHIGNKIHSLGQECRDKVRSVVHRDVRLVVDRGVQMVVIRRVVLALDGVRRDTELTGKSRGDLVLSRERVRRAQHNLGASIA